MGSWKFWFDVNTHMNGCEDVSHYQCGYIAAQCTFQKGNKNTIQWRQGIAGLTRDMSMGVSPQHGPRIKSKKREKTRCKRQKWFLKLSLCFICFCKSFQVMEKKIEKLQGVMNRRRVRVLMDRWEKKKKKNGENLVVQVFKKHVAANDPFRKYTHKCIRVIPEAKTR